MQDGLIKGRYQITQSNAIGRGSFSRVFLGIDHQTQMPVAIKKIDLGSFPENTANKLTQELTIVQLLNHPNIVKTYAVETRHLDVFIVMEYCSGGDYSKLLANKTDPMKEAKVRYYFRQLMEGLKYLRSRQILHRDLKPANLLLTDDNRTLKITDFGFARDLPDNVMTETLCGSPLYMAPEIFLQSMYSTKADLWSLGVILYQSLYGRPPFTSKNQVELLHDLKNGAITYPKNVHVSPACLDLLYGLLHKDPYVRISWSEFFHHPWWFDGPLARSIEPLSHPDVTCVNRSVSSSSHQKSPDRDLDDIQFNTDSIDRSQPKTTGLRSLQGSEPTIGAETSFQPSSLPSAIPRSNPIAIGPSIPPKAMSFSYSPQLIDDYTPTNSPNLVHSDNLTHGSHPPDHPSTLHHLNVGTPDKESEGTLWMVWHAISSSVRFIGSLGSMGGTIGSPNLR
jgi:serine/threonine protein kinase